jgi:type I restriction enzyme, S subunit
LADCVDAVSTGPFGSLLHKDDYVRDGTPVINPVNLRDGQIIHNSEVTVADALAKQLNSYRVRAGDILVARRGDIGRCGLVLPSQDGWICGTGCFVIRTGQAVDPQFLTLLLGSPIYRTALEAVSTGTTMLNLSNKALSNLIISLPPLEEQKRIVAVLDQAFAALDRARALAEANLADAKEVLSRKLDELFNPASSAPTRTIGEVASIQSGAGFPEKEQGSKAGDYPFYKVSDMNLPGNERYLVTANNYIDEPARKTLRASIFPKGSIVFPKVGGAIATNKKRVVEAKGCVDNNVMGLIPDERVVLPEYLHEWLFATDIYEFSNKANPPSITQGTVKEWPFFCPDFEGQTRIVGLVQTMRGEITALNEHYRQTIADLGELRQSFLQKAFAGELT